MKLTADLILQSPQYTNALKDRELDLRGYKIPVIENLGATLDQFDTIDMSENDIRKLEGFPLLKRLKSLLLNNNRICRIAEKLDESLPNLESIVMTSNSMQELKELDPLKSVKSLQYLSLLRNPVTNKPHYRLYVINKLPQLRVLDFQRIKQREREAAKRMFSSKRAQESGQKGERQRRLCLEAHQLEQDRYQVNLSHHPQETLPQLRLPLLTLALWMRYKDWRCY
ncbi:U2 small nuclear ribonucleoprotein A' [Desmophyllum pertusum]|uniref:U2 small nuclear ribonucleoprotein A n=1 Tax=Desmophyllum pertusum TaxID=174260 RepID=A0A9W9YQT5_9CNID|nr:U2 small nuclear ribonucleoprotein A' [Desmophyllum pertusum]